MAVKGKNRIGVILAAGLGARLNNPSPDTIIKPLALVDSMELLTRAITSLEVADCKKAVIVLGWKAKAIQKQTCSTYDGPVKLQFAYNTNFSLKNGLSVLCAKPYVKDEFILTMADHVLDDDIMNRIRDHYPPEGGATLCVDYKMETIFDIDDATKVQAVGSRIKYIGKTLGTYNCIDTGVFIGTGGLMDAIDEVYQKKGDASLSEGVQVLADTGKMEALDIKDAYWQDVDTPDMLIQAEKLLRSYAQREISHRERASEQKGYKIP